MQEKKKRLCRFATETVLLLAEVTLNLALLEELEVLLCRGKKISITKFQVAPNVTELNPYEPGFFNVSTWSRRQTLSKKEMSKTDL
jgi:hypothetical protein